MQPEKQTLYLWNDSIKTTIKPMSSNVQEYNANENAKALAKLFVEQLPGNTLDVLLTAIEKRVSDLVAYGYTDKLTTEFFVGNHIRSVLQELADS